MDGLKITLILPQEMSAVRKQESKRTRAQLASNFRTRLEKNSNPVRARQTASDRVRGASEHFWARFIALRSCALCARAVERGIRR